jgi:enolase
MGSSRIKAGSICRGERVSKYNRLLTIERELGARARFIGA